MSIASTYAKNGSTELQNINTPMNPWNRAVPYQDLPSLPPATDIETKAVIKQCIAARAALAELKQAAELQCGKQPRIT